MFGRLKYWYWCHFTSWKEELAEQRLLNNFYDAQNKKDPSKIIENTEHWLIQSAAICKEFDRKRRLKRGPEEDL